MEHLLTVDSLISLLTLSVLEIVLGIDNVIFVSIIMGKLKEEKLRLKARRIWMVLGITVRVLLLMALSWLVANGNKELFGVDWGERHIGFNLRNCIMFAGGIFLLYKTVKEIHHKLEGAEGGFDAGKKQASFISVMGQIILVDMIFSFDSIITAVGLAKHVEIMMMAVVIAMIIMFLFSENISAFINKHPALKMLALSFLLMVGFSLFFEGLEPVHGSHIDKGYIYFAMAFSFGVELMNMRMRKKSNPVELR
ncbi:MAG: TerC family protein [Sediminibacterium sp.]|jgi:predicted tellurium resistance membrane protein TerC|nr:TerC family protein [Hydrotalea sp.]MCU0337244.1 TerC family protein [Sediminibacterium sp.]